MAGIPITIDYVELLHSTEVPGKPELLPLSDDTMSEVMRGCMLAFERVGKEARSLIVAVNIFPIQSPSGYWPKYPFQPFDYDVRILFKGAAPRALEKDEIRATAELGAQTQRDLPLSERVASHVTKLIVETIEGHATRLTKLGQAWKDAVPQR